MFLRSSLSLSLSLSVSRINDTVLDHDAEPRMFQVFYTNAMHALRTVFKASSAALAEVCDLQVLLVIVAVVRYVGCHDLPFLFACLPVCLSLSEPKISKLKRWLSVPHSRSDWSFGLKGQCHQCTQDL